MCVGCLIAIKVSFSGQQTVGPRIIGTFHIVIYYIKYKQFVKQKIFSQLLVLIRFCLWLCSYGQFVLVPIKNSRALWKFKPVTMQKPSSFLCRL